MGEEYPCGCAVRRYRVGTPAGDSEWSDDERLFRCERHQKEFDKEFAWDLGRGKWVNNDKAYKLKQAQHRLGFLQNQQKAAKEALDKANSALRKQQELVDEIILSE